MTQPSRASLAVLVTSVVVFIISGGPPAVAQGPDLGLPIYPGATKDPEFPPLKTPFMQNLHLLSGDPFDKIVTGYT